MVSAHVSRRGRLICAKGGIVRAIISKKEGTHLLKKTPIQINISDFPREFHSLLDGATVYDSSCSPEARVYYIARGCGYYLKKGSRTTLAREAEMTRYFHSLGLGANMLSYLSLEQDWMLSEAVRGEDCTHAFYLDSPERLCDTMAYLLRSLHDRDGSDCPVRDRMTEYKMGAERNYRKCAYDLSYFLGEDASLSYIWDTAREGADALVSDTLLHGDYCLPNIMLDGWDFAAFIDVGNGGIGDRAVDLYWGAWTLRFNLGTDRWRRRFLDAYGRDMVDEEKIRIVSAFECFG